MSSSQFDVFLCHNSDDKPQVRQIAEQLESLGIRVWLDERELRPGVRWQGILQETIVQTEAAAVFVGSNGLGPCQEQEIESFLITFAKTHRKPIIPVLLSTAPIAPELPIFLQGRTWVDFRQEDPNPMVQLVWGITGKKPTEIGNLEFNPNLSSVAKDVSINDLEQLESFLSAQKWRQADEQTKKIILQNNDDKPLTAPQIRELPLDLLDRIDRLWMDASDGKFGLRIQSQLWKGILVPEKPRFNNPFAKKVVPLTESQSWNRFGCVVGWRGDDEKLIPDAKLNFSLKAPSGCFPRSRSWLHGGFANSVKQFFALMERVEQLDENR
jgi:hypothetical protein